VAVALDFPQGPWSAGYVSWLGSWVWVEAGRLDQAEEALAHLRSSSARHGFDSWELVAATQTAVLEAIAALRSGTADAAALIEHADVIGAHIEFWQALGLRLFLPFYLTTIGTLLAAAGDVDGARQHYEESLALAAETGMRFYDAETARGLAHLVPDRKTVVAELRAALDLARSQGARPFELRIALDLHELVGEEARPLLEQAMGAFDEGATTAELEEARARVMTPR
jgi:tetratricopeptide (TPR) repeat protein